MEAKDKLSNETYRELVEALREAKMRLDQYAHRETYEKANALLVKLGEQEAE